MNTIRPTLPISDVCKSEEKNCTLNDEIKDIVPLKKDSESVDLPTSTDSIIPINKVTCNTGEDFCLEAIDNPQLEEKCLSSRSPPSGNEKSTTSPEWQCGAGDDMADVGSDEENEPRDAIWRAPKTLNELLNDASAVVPFQTFIQQDFKARDMLDFWFACNGLQKMAREDVQKFKDSAKVIWTNLIRNQNVKVSDSIFENIRDNIGKQNISHLLTIFNAAQEEIEFKMENIFFKFRESPIYISWLFNPEDNYFHSSPDEMNLITRPLPTLHEDSILSSQPDDKATPRLSTKNLLRSAKFRESDLNVISEPYGRFPSNSMRHENPYHLAYTIGPTVSTLGSEMHSISSGAQTDETYSFTDSSMDGSSKPRINSRSRRDHHIIRQFARMNQEPLRISSGFASIGPGLRLTKSESSPHKVEEFASTIIKKLEIVRQERESKEKLEQSLLKMAQSENTSDQLRRLHAENSLPPGILAGKLAEKAQQADNDTCQAILDDHVARVWDSPQSPGSPQPMKMKQLPHMNYNQGAKLPFRLTPSPKSLNAGHYGRLSLIGADGRMSQKAGSSSHRQLLSLGGRLMGLDVNSTISSDSGNVADYYDAGDRRIPKSRSMPEAIENNEAIEGRRMLYGSRRVVRRPPPETDSGVSVVSDSNFSPVGGPYLPTERISSWLNQSRQFVPGDAAITQLAYHCDKAGCCKAKGTRSVAGSTSPGTQRRNNSRRSPCSSSLSAKTCYSVHQHKLSPSSTPSCPDGLRNMAASHRFSADRPNRMNSSNSQCMQMHSSFEDQMHSSFDEKTPKPILPKKQPKLGDAHSINDATAEPKSAINASYLSGRQAPQMTSIVYNFQDDLYPFKTKISTSCVTLRKFKEQLPNKGNYRYFFKKFCEDIGSVVFEEITEDTEIVPLFEGKIVSQIRKNQ